MNRIQELRVYLLDNVSLSRGDLLDAVTGRLSADDVEELTERLSGDRQRLRHLLSVMERRRDVYEAFRDGLKANGYDGVVEHLDKLDRGYDSGFDDVELTFPQQQQRRQTAPERARSRRAVPSRDCSNKREREDSVQTIQFRGINMLWVEVFGKTGYLINKQADDGTRSQVMLTNAAWVKLDHLQEQIDDAVVRKREGSWTLAQFNPSTDLRCTVSQFRDVHVINIRVYHDNHPSKQGVSFGKGSLDYLRTWLSKTPETQLGRDVYRGMLLEQVRTTLRQRCAGCSLEAPGQMGHTCQGVASRDTVRDALRNVRLDRFHFQVALATSALERRITLESPGQTFHLCGDAYRQQLEEEVADMF